MARLGTAGLLLGAAMMAGPPGLADAQTVVAGRAAQALRCATYVGMAGQFAYGHGSIDAADRAVMAEWSYLVLEDWVPLAPDLRIAAYRAALDEFGPSWHGLALIDRHADWCLDAFTPL